jgi:hypothetical protein
MMKEFLENFAAILGALTISLLVLSISHEYGYFWNIGSQFQTFLSTTDYFTNGVLWLPLALIYTRYNIDWWRFGEEQKQARNWRRWQSWVWPSICVALFILVIGATPTPAPMINMLLFLGAFVFLWSRVWSSVFPTNVLQEPFQLVARQIAQFGPPAIAGMFVWGWIDGLADLSRLSDPYILKFKKDESVELRIVLRNFEKGVLVRNAAAHRIEFHRWEGIDSVSKQLPGESRSFACWAFEWCPPKTPATGPL